MADSFEIPEARRLDGERDVAGDIERQLALRHGELVEEPVEVPLRKV